MTGEQQPVSTAVGLPRKRKGGKWILLLAVLGLIGVGLGIHVVQWRLARGPGAKALHREAQRRLAASKYAPYLEEFRYPDSFIGRVGADGGSMPLEAWDELLSIGADKSRTQTEKGLEIEYVYRSYGIWLYKISVRVAPDGVVSIPRMTNRAVGWSPREEY